MKSGISVITDKTQQIFSSVAAITANSVYVGIPADKTSRTDGSPINNAQIGYIHERGAPEANIPARPHLLPGIKGSRKKWLPYLGAALKEGFKGNAGGGQSNLMAAGTVAQNAVRAFITDHDNFEPNTPETIKRKGSDAPLIDTGQYRRSITFVIRKS